MRNRFTCLALLMLVAISAGAQSKSFKLYNQVRYNQTPASLLPFLQPIKLAAENVLLNAADSMPNQTAIQNFALTCPPGVPVDLDLETWPFYPDSKLTKTIDKFLTTISYFKAVNTVSPIGFYGVPPKQAYQWSSIDPVNNPSGYASWKHISDSLARLAVKVDLFQPSFYAYDSDTTSWRKMVDTTIAAIKRYSTTKPIYAFIWPQYHQGTNPLQLQFIDTAIWRYELEQLYKKADGVIIWTSNKDTNNSTIYWDPNMPWWQVTKKFMVDKQLSQPFVLDSLIVNRKGNSDNTTWSTSVDTTTYRFIIQRSADGGNNYLSVGDSIAPVATQYTQNHYQYTYNSPGPADNIKYRLMMVNKNGSITYSVSSVVARSEGSLAVLRIGGVNGSNGTTGSSAPASAGSPMHIDSYSVSAGVFTYLSSIDLPVTSTNNIFGSASTGEGYITQSGNKQWLSLMGYASKSASGNIYNTTSNPNLARTLGLIKYDSTLNLSTALLNFPVSGPAATAQTSITNDGTNLWCVTGQGISPMGVLYTTPGSTDATAPTSAIVTSDTGVVNSIKSLSIYGGDLYYVAGSGNRIGTVSATGGLPVMAGSSVMTGLPVSTGSTVFSAFGPSQMVMFDMDSSILGYDVMYVTNNTTTAGLAGVYKYCKNSAGQWVSYGTFGTTSSDGSYFGITGKMTNGLPSLYVTRGISSTQNLATNQLLQLTESSGYNVEMNAAITAVTDATVSGKSGTIRGVAFFPTRSYYYKGTGNLNDLTNWGTNIDGTGTAPANFTDDEQIFFITNGTSATLSGNLTVGGSNSKIILGDGTNATALTIPASFSINAEMDVYNNAVLDIQNVQIPTLHYVARNSTVIYAATANQGVRTMAYGNFNNTNSSAISINGTVTVEGTMLQNGILKGNATLIVPNGLNNSGTLAPGNSAGSFSVTGDFTNNANGNLAIELGGIDTPGVDYDQLTITGTAHIAGVLNITTINGFVPQVAQTFTIVTAKAVTGTFSSVNWPSGIAGNINYTATSVEVNITGITLPLHLLSFSGSVLSTGKNQLQWKTANEANVDFFTVERSGDGIYYSVLLTKRAAGTENNSYRATDDNPLAALNYYRLKMVDKDGRFTYSNVVALKNTAGKVYRLFPNPAENNVLITHPAGELQAFFQVMQSDGKVVKKQKIAVGTTETNLDVSRFSPGVYVIQIRFGNSINTFKLIKK